MMTEHFGSCQSNVQATRGLVPERWPRPHAQMSASKGRSASARSGCCSGDHPSPKHASATKGVQSASTPPNAALSRLAPAPPTVPTGQSQVVGIPSSGRPERPLKPHRVVSTSHGASRAPLAPDTNRRWLDPGSCWSQFVLKKARRKLDSQCQARPLGLPSALPLASNCSYRRMWYQSNKREIRAQNGDFEALGPEVARPRRTHRY